MWIEPSPGGVESLLDSSGLDNELEQNVRSVLEKLDVTYGRCVEVKGAPSQMTLPGALVGRFVDAYTITPSDRTLRRRRRRKGLARGDVS